MSSDRFFKEFYKRSQHFKLSSKRRYNVLWEQNDYSIYQKLKYRIHSNFLPFYFDDKLPVWRKKIRSITKRWRQNDIDFFVLSPIKVGSSQLAVTLFSNPKIISPVVKEFTLKDKNYNSLYYPFTLNSEKKTGYIAPFLIEPFYRKENYTLDRIIKDYPNAKIIIALRDPIKRAFSHWKWEYFLAGKKNIQKYNFLRDFNLYVNKAIDDLGAEPSNYSGFPFLASGLYAEKIIELIEDIGRDKLYFLDMDRYFTNPRQELDKMQKFIGLDKKFSYPDKLPTINENPIHFDKKLILKETTQKLIDYYHEDIIKTRDLCKIGESWLSN